MNGILNLPEIVALEGAGNLIRIPNQIDVPATPRVMRLLDTPAFQRLKRISQLGLVSLVYPGAHHNRFEHSLGVYRMGLLFLRQLAHSDRFTTLVKPRDATVLILAALLHDLGHWPFCHPIEDLKLEGVPSHEAWCENYLLQGALRDCLLEDWNIHPAEILDLINKRSTTPVGKLLSSILSGPIDIDKLDYLYRDSLHCGVPYGQNFDSPRLIRSLCVDSSNERLAISHKGKTAAEMLVFARYVMFSEVYWHHAVRAATAMFQRAFFRWYLEHSSTANLSLAQHLDSLLDRSETDMIEQLRVSSPPGQPDLLDALFGPQRKLYKRVASFSFLDGDSTYRQIAQRPYPWLVDLSTQLAALFSSWVGLPVHADQVLVDSPPVGLEVQFDVQVYYSHEDRYEPLEAVSPVVQALAKRQFDDYVKQVRIFVAPELQPTLVKQPEVRQKIRELIEYHAMDTRPVNPRT